MNKKQPIIWISRTEKIVGGRFCYLATPANQLLLFILARKKALTLMHNKAPEAEVMEELTILCEIADNIRLVTEHPDRQIWLEIPMTDVLMEYIVAKLKD